MLLSLGLSGDVTLITTMLPSTSRSRPTPELVLYFGCSVYIDTQELDEIRETIVALRGGKGNTSASKLVVIMSINRTTA